MPEEEVPSGLDRLYGGNWRGSARSADAAYSLVGGILGLGLIGWMLDRWLGTSPAGLLVGLLIGGAVGFYVLGKLMLGGR